MARSPQTAPTEQKKAYHVVKAFKGVNTQANRTAIDEAEFSWLENAMPVGFGNIKITPAHSTVANAAGNAVSWSNTVTALGSVNLGLSNYITAFQADGSLQAFNLTTLARGNVAIAGTFSGANVRASQWKNERLLILDPIKGYFTWDGNAVVEIGAVGVIGLISGGTGYTTPPSVRISGPDSANGVQANASALISSNSVVSIVVTDAGTGYTNAANLTVTISGPGSGAQAVAQLVTFRSNTVSLLVTNPGTGFTNAANITVTVTGGGGANAAGKAILSGNQVSQIITTNPGTGYTNSANLSVTITGGGGTNATAQAIINSQPNVDIASFSGRVWIAFGRTVAFSAAGDYSDFTSVSAGTEVLSDSTLRGNLQALLSANNFLYLFGEDSINVFSDVRVTSLGATIFTNTNISASVGTRRIGSIFPYFRSVLFMNDYGIYALVGSTTSKLSDPLDGIFPRIDFTQPITGGQVLLNNILCAAFSFTYTDPLLGSRPIQAVFFDKKWFFTSQGTVKYVTSVPNGLIHLYGTGGADLAQFYADAGANIASTIQTALNSMGDPIRDKQALHYGIEASFVEPVVMDITIDSEQKVGRTSGAIVQTNATDWVNNSGAVVLWTNNAGNTVQWLYANGYALYTGDAQMWGKYLGMGVTSNSPGFTIHTFEYEHVLRARF